MAKVSAKGLTVEVTTIEKINSPLMKVWKILLDLNGWKNWTKTASIVIDGATVTGKNFKMTFPPIFGVSEHDYIVTEVLESDAACYLAFEVVRSKNDFYVGDHLFTAVSRFKVTWSSFENCTYVERAIQFKGLLEPLVRSVTQGCKEVVAQYEIWLGDLKKISQQS